MPRIYFNFSIDELERLFAENGNSRDILINLHDELTCRTTARAKELRGKVAKNLAAMPKNISSKVSRTSKLQSSQQQEIDFHGCSKAASTHRQKQADPLETQRRMASRESPPPQSKPQQPFPAITNQPVEVLSSWTALEVLSPSSYDYPKDLANGDKNRVVQLNPKQLPWAKPTQSQYFQIVLGELKLKPAIERLIQKYGDTRVERPGVRDYAILAFVIVDRSGKLADSPAVGISSFAWGVMCALNADLANLAKWPDFELGLIQKLECRLRGTLTWQAILAAYDFLVTELDLPPTWIKAPSFAIRPYSEKSRNPLEPLLLNSFFLADLALARNLFVQGKPPKNLQKYLGSIRPRTRHDLLQDTLMLAHAVSPVSTPLARWPGKERHPLVLLQQAAVNLAFQETKNGGLVGINGPPGTGKTTLLRDIVAGVVTDRAMAMSSFDDPETAFVSSGLKLKVGAGFIPLYRLDAKLRGFEMLVASSNNKAVENVSAELPGIGAIAADTDGLRYLKTLSDGLHASETWGAIAAVLGNAQNRSRFKQTFWWDEDIGLRNYFQEVAGFPVIINAIDPITGLPVEKIPRIIELESPPTSHGEAIQRWNTARKRFQEAVEKSQQWQAWLENLRSDLAKRGELERSEREAQARLKTADDALQRYQAIFADACALQNRTIEAVTLAEQECQSHEKLKPGFWARVFRTRIARQWSATRCLLADQLQTARAELDNVAKTAKQAESESQAAFKNRDHAEANWQKAATLLGQCRRRLDEAQEKYGVRLADDAFFAQPRKSLQLGTPWYPAVAQQARDEVFIAAMALHRAFLDAAAKPLRHNLGALMNVFNSQALPDAKKQALLPDLWSSLFLVVPLVSTTFASMNRMLGKLPLESLGWLLVDEAGQALPQAMAGALLRTQRAVVVGDPIQIQPIVPLPDTLIQAICRRFGVDPDIYAAPNASAQTLADAASDFATEFPTREGSRTVGVPLLVHRRCSSPMFNVANAVAYSGLMVSAKSMGLSRIRDVLGPSDWINVEGSGEDKWCEAEGEIVLSLLAKLRQAEVKPDIYIITPFVIVADRLRQVVRDSQILDGWVEEEGWRWSNGRIGTVHTVQGREAEAVIFVLGAPNPAQTGARGWAGWPPNLVNVAVTRAKEALYVIGNRQLWRQAGCFQELDQRLSNF